MPVSGVLSQIIRALGKTGFVDCYGCEGGELSNGDGEVGRVGLVERFRWL